MGFELTKRLSHPAILPDVKHPSLLKMPAQIASCVTNFDMVHCLSGLKWQNVAEWWLFQGGIPQWKSCGWKCWPASIKHVCKGSGYIELLAKILHHSCQPFINLIVHLIQQWQRSTRFCPPDFVGCCHLASRLPQLFLAATTHNCQQDSRCEKTQINRKLIFVVLFSYNHFPCDKLHMGSASCSGLWPIFCKSFMWNTRLKAFGNFLTAACMVMPCWGGMQRSAGHYKETCSLK